MNKDFSCFLLSTVTASLLCLCAVFLFVDESSYHSLILSFFQGFLLLCFLLFLNAAIGLVILRRLEPGGFLKALLFAHLALFGLILLRILAGETLIWSALIGFGSFVPGSLLFLLFRREEEP